MDRLSNKNQIFSLVSGDRNIQYRTCELGNVSDGGISDKKLKWSVIEKKTIGC